VPVVDEVPELVIADPTWVFLDWQSSAGLGVEIIKRLRLLVSAAPVQFYLILSSDQAREYGDLLKATNIQMILAPLDVSRLLACVDSDPLPNNLDASRFSLGELFVDVRAYLVKVGGQMVSLSPTEFQLLVYFLRCRGRAISRAELVLAVMRNGREVQERSIDVWVSRLKRSLKGHGVVLPLRSVKGIGYVMDE
jgi:two-component system phosphate regulon response regulator PhoB